jgi:hypothetical protein
MIKYTVVFLIVLSFFPSLSVLAGTENPDTSKTIIKGFILGNQRRFIEGANIVIEGTIDGATSDEKGYFEFETQKTGQHTLIITAVDYGEKKIKVDIKPGSTQTLDIILSKTDYKTDEITVTASSFTSGENSRVTLTPLEIARIPGANADLYRAITTFPGSNQVDEGSRIAVRGGDPDEVLTFLDGASLYSPFVFDDSYNTSSFSTVNPWGMKGINFSSGGFSARYGNVLSAVLDLQTYDMPRTSGLFAVVGLANANISGVHASKDGKFGASFSAGQFYIKPFLEINNLTTDYSPIPTASNIGGTLMYKTSKTGLLKLYANYSYDNLGIRSISPTYNGYYTGKSHNFFTNLKYSFAPTAVSLLNMSLSFSDLKRNDAYGILDSKTEDVYSKFRADFSTPVSSVFDFAAGAEYEYNGYKIDGTFPIFSYNVGMNAPAFTLSDNKNTGRIGAYIETKAKVHADFLVVAGLRSDYFTLSEKMSVDPRISLVYRISGNSFLKGAAGIYHQNPALPYFLRGNTTNIKPEQAIHYILGYEYNRDNNYILRIESYYKDYSNLLAYDPVNYLSVSEGTGIAKGVDVFLKMRFRPKFNGWISYAYSDSKRKQYGTAQETSANYDITHTLSVVGSYNISDKLTAGATYKISTGKPYTPVIGSAYDPMQNVYIPLYDITNSGRLPTFQRIDINLQYVFSMFGRFAVAFFALNNVLNTHNVYQYEYNFDYSRKDEVYSNNRRVIYFGIGLQL